jgi:GH15 family glucan-1,4-alpha-glucosidase
MKMKYLILCVISAMAISCQQKGGMSPELRKKIEADTRLQTVSAKAEALIQSGLNAGDGYSEVWIRDLNTFIEPACKVCDKSVIREALLTFFKFQGEDGNIVDGYTQRSDRQNGGVFFYSDLAPQYAAHKNSVETDQETSLVQAIFKYVKATGDKAFLDEQIKGLSVKHHLSDALSFLLNHRYSKEYGLLWGATTVDWGDVQPEHNWGVLLDSSSHRSIDIYDNAMFVIALNDFLSLSDTLSEKVYWENVRDSIAFNVRKHLWDAHNRKFIPHIYLEGSPFPADFNEDAIHYHGGTAIAIEAGLLKKDEILAVYRQMQQNVAAAGAQTIGLTIYPVYPNGFFKNPGMYEYGYQNGGDWTWFGGRMVQQLIANGFYDEACEALSPMLDRVIAHNGFYEWWTPDGQPKGSGLFRGSAGVLWKAIEELKRK